MILKEVHMDIMNVPQGYYLAQAISADLNFSVGLPALFDVAYDMSKKFEKEAETYEEFGADFNPVPGQVYLIDNVFNLIVKETSYDRPSREHLLTALVDLREEMEDLYVTKLAIPRICCGRNGLDWREVRNVIEFIFHEFDGEILVCVQ